MALHALDAIDDALSATRKYRPRGLWGWLWLGIVAISVGSPGIGIPTGGGGTGGAPSTEEQAALEELLPASLPDIVAVVVGAVLLLWMLFIVFGALLEFPFLRWLRDGEYALRSEVRAHWKQGVGLAVFRVVLNAVSLGAIAALVVFAAGTDAGLFEYLLVLNDYWLIIGLIGLLVGAVAAFTTAFVVPVMVLENRGVIGGWRRFWPTLTGAKKQFIAYAVAVAILGYIGGILVAIAAIVVFIPVAIVGLVLAFTISATVAIGVIAVLGGAVMTVAVVGTLAIVQVFLRYYALLVLGDVDETLDYIPERRSELRGPDTVENDPAA